MITGVKDKEHAELYLENAWNAVKYLLDNYPQVFVGIGIPYNKILISREEILEIGERITKISKAAQVCVLDYRPAFRRNLEQPAVEEMKEIKELLNIGYSHSCSLSLYSEQLPYQNPCSNIDDDRYHQKQKSNLNKR